MIGSWFCPAPFPLRLLFALDAVQTCSFFLADLVWTVRAWPGTATEVLRVFRATKVAGSEVECRRSPCRGYAVQFTEVFGLDNPLSTVYSAGASLADGSVMAASSVPTQVAWADLSGDGYPDFVTSLVGSERAILLTFKSSLRQTGSLSFTPPLVALPGPATTALRAGIPLSYFPSALGTQLGLEPSPSFWRDTNGDRVPEMLIGGQVGRLRLMVSNRCEGECSQQGICRVKSGLALTRSKCACLTGRCRPMHAPPPSNSTLSQCNNPSPSPAQVFSEWNAKGARRITGVGMRFYAPHCCTVADN